MSIRRTQQNYSITKKAYPNLAGYNFTGWLLTTASVGKKIAEGITSASKRGCTFGNVHLIRPFAGLGGF
ncbi:hypothetical protein DUE52_25620 [Larkinella punicea]|uniref:Uncharacterized protein n=1 Tax=Larkinella punicea TaxID=2315727 RepID=A0A368JGA1_9BACT|nr:hypothetical protein DUE52_25620 [Larkinella punicea]